MGTAGDMAVMGVTGAIRKRPAKGQSSQRQWPQRPTAHTAAQPLRRRVNGIGMGADASIEIQILSMRRSDMSKTTHTHEHPSAEPKKHGCCGESHANAEKAQPAAQEQANPQGASKREHSHHSGDSSCCCGSDKASK
ncbi:MAG: hypothetical protein K8F92_08760 [Hyphomicrobium sp.]|uniref:hypothetical protein n=1 Tax=Hyphomicrobium sp. TaxID=82 RepID=UPI0025BDB5D7|nr:hypothetical protein [Hyphomicrobium sp.]MBZ0209733.1 hypothetical protein [Hyphomicrobium sp.]